MNLLYVVAVCMLSYKVILQCSDGAFTLFTNTVCGNRVYVDRVRDHAGSTLLNWFMSATPSKQLIKDMNVSAHSFWVISLIS
jgi:hypothetical protein